MYDTTELSLPHQVKKIVTFFMLLYPESYRRQFGNDTLSVFEALYREELVKNGSVSMRFWFVQLWDLTKSIITEHKDLIKKVGVKKYLKETFHITKYNIIGFFFLLPFLLLFTIDLLSRIAQGDLTHYNRPVYHYLSQTPLYAAPVLYTIIIVFPLLAIAFNVIPLLLQKRKSFFSFVFMRKNILTLCIILAGIFCISIIKLHDFLPCMIHGVLRGGLLHFSKLFPYCQKA